MVRTIDFHAKPCEANKSCKKLNFAACPTLGINTISLGEKKMQPLYNISFKSYNHISRNVRSKM